MKFSSIFSVFLLLVFVFQIDASRDDELKESEEIKSLLKVSSAFKKVAKKVNPSVVTLEIYYRDESINKMHKDNPLYRKIPLSEMPLQKGAGTGVIYNIDGYVVTNQHVVANAVKVKVKLIDGRKIDAEIVGQDPQTDIAVLKIDNKDIKAAEFGDSDKVEVGEWAIAIGNPLGFSHTVTVGIISAKGRSQLRERRANAYEDFIQTDAAINQGNSGGPLCNIYGQVIGINSMIASSSGGSQGIAFTIPMNMVRNVVDQLIQNGKIERGFLGVYIQDLNEKLVKAFSFNSLEGALIDSVSFDSPADEGGLKSGDIVVKINDKKVLSGKDLRNMISMVNPGKSVKIQLFRSGNMEMLDVKIGSHKKDPQEVQTALGLSVVEINEEILQKFRLKSGVIIDTVEPGSPADKRGLKPGLVIESVDNISVKSPDDFFTKVLDSLEETDKHVMLYIRSIQTGFFIFLER